MKSHFLNTIGLSLIWTIAISVLPIARSQESPTSPNIKIGQILQIEGNVQIDRDGRILMPTVGTSVYPDDTILSPENGQAFVQCADGNVALASNGQQLLDVCPPAPEKNEGCPHGVIECPPLGDRQTWENVDFPYILSPHRTMLLDDRPTLSWSPVEGATNYQVTFFANGEPVGATVETTETTISYPEDWDALEPGGYDNFPISANTIYEFGYSLEVLADTGTTSYDTPRLPAEMEVILLDPDHADRVLQARSQIEQLDLVEDAKTVAIARIYTDNLLVVDAIATLETLVPANAEPVPEKAAIYQQLGDLYWNYLGIAPEAEQYYSLAAEVVASDNLEQRTSTFEAWGQVLVALGREEDAIAALTEAKTGYETLGNLEKVENLQQQINELQQSS